MKEIEKYYDNTENKEPNYILKEFLKLNGKPGKAIEIGCGAGRDTKALIKHGWNVLAIDKEEVEARISRRLNEDEKRHFRFSKQKSENIELEEADLILANFSLAFCDKNYFKEMWKKIEESSCKDGYFVGNFFGEKDEWNDQKERMTFLTLEQVKNLFDKNFDIIKFEEVEKDAMTGMRKMKHWHVINVIAKKK